MTRTTRTVSACGISGSAPGGTPGPLKTHATPPSTKAFPLTGPVTPWPSAALASALLITVHEVAFPAECPGGEGAGVVADPLPHAAVSTPITTAAPVIVSPYRLHRTCDLPASCFFDVVSAGPRTAQPPRPILVAGRGRAEEIRAPWEWRAPGTNQ